jgi:hypothetical protein
MLLVLPTAMLAGCSGEPAPDDPEADPTNVVTDPLDYSYLQNATPGSHIHDYWQGRDRVQVLDNEGSGSFSSSCSGSGCAENGMLFSSRMPADGVIVPQGTRWVNGTFTLTPDGENTWTRFELWLRTAEDAETVKWGDIENGVPFSIESTADRNDPPHYVLSLWQFAVRAYGAEGADNVRVAGEVAWDVEAVRGLPLVAYPPHPDRWNGADELDLLEETGSSVLTTYEQDPNGGTSTSCYAGCPDTHRLGDGIVVPFETATLEVRITYGPGLPTGLGLAYHGASTRASSSAQGTNEAPGVTLYSIPIDVGMADSPYARQSLWEFDVWLEYPQDPQYQVWSGQYTITVKAIRG